MAADASIYGLIQQPKQFNPLEALTGALKAQGMQQEGQLNQLKLAALGRDQERKNSLLALANGWNSGTTDDQRIGSLKNNGYFDEADKLEQGLLKRQEVKSTTQKNASEALGKFVDAQGNLATQVMANPSPAFANMALDSMAAHAKYLGFDHVLPQIEAERQAVAGMTPDQIKQWAAGHALKSEKLLPTIQTRNTGGTTDTLAIDPLTGKPTVTGSVKNTQTPDSIATNATSRANNAANIAKDLQVAGMTAGGGLDDNSERTAQAIASGQLPAPTGMALLNPRNQRILGRVMEINPQYDSTTVDAKKKAARDFTSGSQGNAMRSFAVAGQHLDQLGELADAMNNGNLQLVNKIANTYSQQTGSPAVTNFDAAKDVVSKEVVKAIVAGGGGVAEREELSKLMANAKSPAQLKGVIQQYRSLMAAQHDALLQQRRAAGLPDSTLPNYTDANGSPAGAGVPADIAAILQKHGGR